MWRTGESMSVPYAHNVEVPDRKLTGYLLDHAHPQNKGKAAFYEIVGFTKENSNDLRAALLSHVFANEVAKFIQTDFGIWYVVEGWMPCPNGRQYLIRSVWFIENGEEIPKLVTAYPNWKIMIYESDLVALLIDLPNADLVRGDVGTVAMIHGDQKGFEIEFVNADGKTIAIETLSQNQIKKIKQEKAILHVRDSLPPAEKIIVLDEESMAKETSAPMTASAHTITIELSNLVLEQKGATRDDLKLQLALFLFQQDFFSLGKASEFTGLHPIQFQKELANKQIPVHYDVNEYRQDTNTLDNYMNSSHTTLVK